MTDDLADAPVTVSTADGVGLEATWSGRPDAEMVAVLTHPHPRFGGDMHNVVPATLARTLPGHGVATLRFNFRGTGRSSGRHGDGEAEIGDVRAAVDLAAATFADRAVAAVGYSFGADVLLALDHPVLVGVIAVAPPLAVLPEPTLAAPRGNAPTLLLSPTHDQFRAYDDAVAIAGGWPDTSVQQLPGTDHFLAGAMGRVEDLVAEFLAGLVRGMTR